MHCSRSMGGDHSEMPWCVYHFEFVHAFVTQLRFIGLPGAKIFLLGYGVIGFGCSLRKLKRSLF